MQKLGFLGVALDPAANAANAPLISVDPAAVRVILSDEDVVFARAATRLAGVGPPTPQE